MAGSSKSKLIQNFWPWRDYFPILELLNSGAINRRLKSLFQILIQFVPRWTDAELFPSKWTWSDKIDFTDENDKYADWIPKIAMDRRRLRITDYLDERDNVLDADSGKTWTKTNGVAF